MGVLSLAAGVTVGEDQPLSLGSGTVPHMVRFLHTADWQLGMTRHFLPPEAQSRFTAARLDAIATLGGVARDEGCRFVVVCGDVFETNHVDRQVVVRALTTMGAVEGVTFYLLPGNHDPLDAASVFRSRTFLEHGPDNVVVLDTPGVHPVAEGVEIVAAPWFSKRPLSDLLADAAAPLTRAAEVRIAVGHGALDVTSPDAANPALISLARLEDHLAEGRLHYVALGDRHSTTSVGATGRVWYSGAPEPTDFTEVDPGNVLVVEVTATEVEVRPVPVGTWRFLRLDREVAGIEDVGALRAELEGVADPLRTIVRLGLVGQLSLTASAQLDEIVDHHGDLLASLSQSERRSELVTLPDDDDLGSLDLAGFAREAADDLAARAAGGGEDAATARDALALLYRLGGSR